MANGKVHWLREWLLSHLLWEGFKYILPTIGGTAVIAFIFAIIRWLGGHPNTIFLISSFVGSSVLTALYVFRENARRVRPILNFGEARSQGLYEFEPNKTGFTVLVTNDQHKFDTVAHNVKASLHFRHALGDKVRTYPSLWVVDDPATGKRKLADFVSLGMGEQRYLLILFWDVNAPVLSFARARG